MENYIMGFSQIMNPMTMMLCLIGTFLGIFFGASPGMTSSMGIALALALSYYLMTVVITWLENFPYLRPDILIWVPNLLFIVLGTVLMLRASRN